MVTSHAFLRITMRASRSLQRNERERNHWAETVQFVLKRFGYDGSGSMSQEAPVAARIPTKLEP